MKAALVPLLLALTLAGSPVAAASTTPSSAATDEPTSGPQPAQFQTSPPQLSAESWILYDETFDRRLGSRQPDERRAIASTTKMMTALVVLEHASLEEWTVVSERAAAVGEAEIGLVAGERLTVEDLLVALLVDSANDAATALAEHVGGTVERFVGLMNLQARELGLYNTRFANPHGLDEPGHYSTAADLLTLARAGMAYPVFADLVRTPLAPFPADPLGHSRRARTTNTLLRSYPGAFGIKTGFTAEAGLALVAGADRDGRRLYSVVLGSEDHFADTAALLEYGFSAFGPVEVFTSGTSYATQRVGELVGELLAAEESTVFLASQDADEIELRPSRHQGAAQMSAFLHGEQVASVPLRGARPPTLPSTREAAAWASRYWEWLWGTG